MQFIFVGTLANGGFGKLDHFGQSVDLDEAEAKHLRGPAVIPTETFNEIGFTAEELEKYKYPGPRSEAPAEFQFKYAQALVARSEYVGGDR